MPQENTGWIEETLDMNIGSITTYSKIIDDHRQIVIQPFGDEEGSYTISVFRVSPLPIHKLTDLKSFPSSKIVSINYDPEEHKFVYSGKEKIKAVLAYKPELIDFASKYKNEEEIILEILDNAKKL